MQNSKWIIVENSAIHIHFSNFKTPDLVIDY